MPKIADLYIFIIKNIMMLKTKEVIYMQRFIHDEANGLCYELVDDYYLPCLKTPKSPKVGRFGMMYNNYLRRNKWVTYSGLMLSGKLNEHIENIDRQAEEMFAILVEQMKQTEEITEQLKATDQLKWVALMNNIRSRAEEVVFNELIYS